MHTIHNQSRLTARLNRIQGQVEGLKKMLEQESECQEVLQQIAALRGAVNGLMWAVMERHLHEHIVSQNDERRIASGIGGIEIVFEIERRNAV